MSYEIMGIKGITSGVSGPTCDSSIPGAKVMFYGFSSDDGPFLTEDGETVYALRTISSVDDTMEVDAIHKADAWTSTKIKAAISAFLEDQ